MILVTAERKTRVSGACIDEACSTKLTVIGAFPLLFFRDRLVFLGRAT
jgi:hypothetical protein